MRYSSLQTGKGWGGREKTNGHAKQEHHEQEMWSCGNEGQVTASDDIN